MGDVRE